MSKLRVDNFYPATGSYVYVYKPNNLYAPGSIIQVKHSVVMQRSYHYAPNNDGGMRGDYAGGVNSGGMILRPLDITITPKSQRSYIHVEFNIFYEANENTLFSVLRDGNLVGAVNPEGTNAADSYLVGKWLGAGVARYDNNGDSTPGYIQLCWVDSPGTIKPTTYSVACKSSNGNNYSMTLNCTYSNYQYGADAYEQGVSFAIAREIAR